MSEKEKDLIPFVESPEQMQALEVLRTRKVPKEHISTREQGGRNLSYIKHGYVTQTLQDALGIRWGFEVVSWDVFDETLKIGGSNRNIRSVAANVRLTEYRLIPKEYRQPGDPLIFERSVSEVGAFILHMGSMPLAHGVASAVSRGLVKAAMRMFGIGLELYTTDDDIDNKTAWNMLKRMALNVNKKVWTEEFIKTLTEKLQEADISNEDLVERFQDAYEILGVLLNKKIKWEDVPKF